MTIRNFSVFPTLGDSVFSDRFNKIDRLFSHLTGNSPVGVLPPYNLCRLSEERYLLTVSVPGWKEKELEIETAGGALLISGKKENEKETNIKQKNWIHKGINRTNFRLSYNVSEHVKVTRAKLEDGLLLIEIYQEIPENEKPRKIQIEHKTKTLNDPQ